jgi:hypothetical protein
MVILGTNLTDDGKEKKNRAVSEVIPVHIVSSLRPLFLWGPCVNKPAEVSDALLPQQKRYKITRKDNEKQ